MAIKFTQREKLELFVRRVQELVSRRFYQSGGLSDIKFEWKFSRFLHENTITNNMDEVDEEDFRSFLLSFRLFVASSEPTYIGTVIDLCEAKLSSKPHKENLEKTKKEWIKQSKESSPFIFAVGGEIFTSFENLSMWLNGTYFHSDAEKIHRIEKWSHMELNHAQFIMTIQSVTIIIVWMGQFVDYGLKHNLFDL